jgi:hypothetical protein
MARAHAREKFSQRKISATFLEFAEPLWVPLVAEATDQELEQVFMVAFTVWNAVVFDAVAGNHRQVEEMRKLTAHDPGIQAVVEHLIARKQSLFGNDDRLIGEYRLERRQGELRLRAEARRPNRAR